MTKNRVTVVIPTYNRADYLSETIGSIFAQSFKDVEIVVVDDASTDNTPIVMKQFDPAQVRYIRLEKNSKNPARPRNVGIKAANTELVALFDSDDLMEPMKLEEQVRFLDRHTDIPFVFTNFINFTKEGRDKHDFLYDHEPFHRIPKQRLADSWYRLPSEPAYNTLIPDNYIGTSGILFRRSLVEEVGNFDESLYYSEDIEWFFRIARAHDIGYIDKVYHGRRMHQSNISSRLDNVFSQLKAYGQQEKLISPQTRRDWQYVMAELLFTAGYSERLKGNRVAALRFYVRSFLARKNLRVLLSMARALMPVEKKTALI